MISARIATPNLMKRNPPGLSSSASPAISTMAPRIPGARAGRRNSGVGYEVIAPFCRALRCRMISCLIPSPPYRPSHDSQRSPAPIRQIPTGRRSTRSLPCCLNCIRQPTPYCRARSRWAIRSCFAGSGAPTLRQLIWGRGTLDDKGSLACIFDAVEGQVLAGHEREADLYLSLDHDEETEGSGAAAIGELHPP